jgi:hypothetical protein
VTRGPATIATIDLVSDDGAACLRVPVTDAISGTPARAADGGAQGDEGPDVKE